MNLSDAVKVYIGADEADKVMLGGEEVYSAGGGARKYTLLAYNNSSDPYGGACQYYPTEWKFQGSNNDSDWTDIDSQTGITSWSPGVKNEYTFANSTRYRYYRWLFSDGESADFLVIKEAEIMEAAGEGYGDDICTGGTASAETEYSGSYPASKAFDDDITSEYSIWNSAPSWGPTEWLKYDLGE